MSTTISLGIPRMKAAQSRPTDAAGVKPSSSRLTKALEKAKLPEVKPPL
ncbi:MAG: hypothetical protein ABIX28_14890 [Vicinamibacterales bacterium]